MKTYQNRTELTEDINFIYNTLTGINDQLRDDLINKLFKEWLERSNDSPFYTENVSEPFYTENVSDEYLTSQEVDVAKILLKINEHTGISNQWKGEHIKFEEVKRSKHYNLRRL